MIKVVKSENLTDVEKYVVIIPSNYEIYYKKKFINKNVTCYTLKNLLLKIYNGNKKLATKEEKYVIMYETVKQLSSSLKQYSNLISSSFINDLINTYDLFNDCDLNENQKVNDLKLIYQEYEKKLLNNGLINEKMLYEHVLKNNDFSGQYLFLKLFKINNLELEIIKKMSKQANVLINTYAYNKTLEKKLRKIDDTVKLSEEEPFLEDKKIYYKTLNDISDEVSFISNDISKKVMEGNKLSDFLIVSNNIEAYYPYFNLLFSYPHSISEKTGILTNRFMNLFLNILMGDFSCKNFINILKLNLFNVELETIDKLDNYVYKWDLYDTNFYLPFTYTSYLDNNDLDELNNAKESIILPIKYLLENISGKVSLNEILTYLYTYLSEEEIITKLFNMDENGALKLINAFDIINDNLSSNSSLQDVINVLLGFDFSKTDKRFMKDEITISNLTDAVFEGKRYVYVIGAVNDNIPSNLNGFGLLNNNDIKKDYLVELSNEHLGNEKCLFNNAINNKNVIITSYKLGLDLKLKLPSSYLNELNLKDVLLEKLYDKNLLLNDYAISLSKDTIDMVEDLEFNKINLSNKHDLNYKISPDIVKKLYDNVINLSPSSIETYAKCPFYFFCEKELKLKVKEKFTFDNRQVGTFIHYVLEKIIKNDLNDITTNNINNYVSKYLEDYLKDNSRMVDNTTLFVVKELSLNVTKVIKNIVEEMKITKFKPRYFEFKIDDESIIKPICLKLSKGTLKVTGIADRIDVFESGDSYYYRIIDYKTGGKKFRLDDVLLGLNLQMLIYLLAIKESKSFLTNKDVIPSGLLYYPSLLKEKSVSRSISDEEKNKSVKERLKMNGIINKDVNVLDVFGGKNIGEYVSVITKEKLNDEYLFDSSDLAKIFDCIKATLIKIGNNINDGIIGANPIGGRIDSCKYCKYQAICKFDLKKDKKIKPKDYKNSEVIKQLEGDYNA